MLLQFLGFHPRLQLGEKSSLIGYVTFLCSAAAFSPIGELDDIELYLEEWAPREPIPFMVDHPAMRNQWSPIGDNGAALLTSQPGSWLVEVAAVRTMTLNSEVNIFGPTPSILEEPNQLTPEVKKLMVEYTMGWLETGHRGCSH